MMKKTLLMSALFLLSCSVGGCFVVIGNRSEKCPPDYTKDPQVAATIAEIDAVSKLSFESHRVKAYKAIASRPNLGPRERMHLMDAVNKHLSFDSHRQEVLMILLENRPQRTEEAAVSESCIETQQGEL